MTSYLTKSDLFWKLIKSKNNRTSKIKNNYHEDQIDILLQLNGFNDINYFFISQFKKIGFEDEKEVNNFLLNFMIYDKSNLIKYLYLIKYFSYTIIKIFIQHIIEDMRYCKLWGNYDEIDSIINDINICGFHNIINEIYKDVCLITSSDTYIYSKLCPVYFIDISGDKFKDLLHKKNIYKINKHHDTFIFDNKKLIIN
jgi:hypothetical protein